MTLANALKVHLRGVGNRRRPLFFHQVQGWKGRAHYSRRHHPATPPGRAVHSRSRYRPPGYQTRQHSDDFPGGWGQGDFDRLRLCEGGPEALETLVNPRWHEGLLRSVSQSMI